MKCAVAIRACWASNCLSNKGFPIRQRRFLGIRRRVLAANFVLDQGSVQRC